jgi:hypothetical protein
MSRIIRSPEKEKEYKKKCRLHRVVFFLFVVFVFFLIAYVPSRSALQIKDVVVKGNKVLLGKTVEQKAKEELFGKYWYFFPKTNILFYPAKTLSIELKNFFPRIENLSVELNTSRVLTISIKEREPFALWCGREVLEIESGDACFYLDNQGFVFDRAPYFSGNPYFVFYGKGLLPEENPLGHEFLSLESFLFLSRIKESLVGFHTNPINVFVTENNEAFFAISSGLGVRINTEDDISLLETNMQAVFRSGSWAEKVATGNIEYLDFRFGNKVFYKYKNTDPASIE